MLGPMVLRTLIVDDNERFLDAASSSLGRELEVVGTAQSSVEALRLTAEHRPSVVLVDIGLGEESGFDLARRLEDGFPELGLRIVMISTRSEDDYVELIASSPAIGFLPKSQLSATAVRALVSTAAA
jgi:DNA-binding NarL/FixJ family response regulator